VSTADAIKEMFAGGRTSPHVKRSAQMNQSASPADLSDDLWEPIETAPLDETPIRVRNGNLRATVSWSNSINAWVIGLATEPELCDRILPWRPTSWTPVPGSLD
jgi:hypothetical protein